MSDSRPSNGQSVYRWVCPLCDESNVGTAVARNPMASGVDALKSHIRAVDDEIHGSKHKTAKRVNDVALCEYVETISPEED